MKISLFPSHGETLLKTEYYERLPCFFMLVICCIFASVMEVVNETEWFL